MEGVRVYHYRLFAFDVCFAGCGFGVGLLVFFGLGMGVYDKSYSFFEVNFHGFFL